ncbi:hypothetical protein CJD36_008380 [Flavipsychrobacter stenotrophus]|uniref:Uncharacterized protein n=1 Tax=Flavipsychrobacter stenotrophus TaxID=2077091 RepID=A0A2S7SYW3_9BACT|nr:hypothetical protein [Flavipsychrobacter stenotrophus]PQJ11801.1 hypothetical protein CJD36_008380 [Flavipsychrobacter stenotrophus]
MTPKKILLVGIDPYIIDFNGPEFAALPGLTAQKVEAGIKGAAQQLGDKGHEAEICWTDFGLTAANILEKKLQQTQFDIVLIGAGIRIPEKNFLLFEQMINVVHKQAPNARIGFNTHPTDTIAAVERQAF